MAGDPPGEAIGEDGADIGQLSVGRNVRMGKPCGGRIGFTGFKQIATGAWQCLALGTIASLVESASGHDRERGSMLLVQVTVDSLGVASWLGVVVQCCGCGVVGSQRCPFGHTSRENRALWALHLAAVAIHPIDLL